VDWIELAQDMAHWRHLVNAVSNTSGETLDQLNEYQLISKTVIHTVS
jgi:hypothetical protein